MPGRRWVSPGYVGYDNCALRWHLDSVPPKTPIRDIVDRCGVWESHADTGARRIVKPGPERTLPVYTVDEPVCVLDDSMVAAVTMPPVVPDHLETLLRRLLSSLSVPAPASECTGWGLAGAAGPVRRDWATIVCFPCGMSGTVWVGSPN